LNQSSHITHCSYAGELPNDIFDAEIQHGKLKFGAFLLLNQKGCVLSAFMNSKKSRMKREIFVQHAIRAEN